MIWKCCIRSLLHCGARNFLFKKKLKFCCDSCSECETEWIFWNFCQRLWDFEVDRIRWRYQVWNLPSFLPILFVVNSTRSTRSLASYSLSGPETSSNWFSKEGNPKTSKTRSTGLEPARPKTVDFESTRVTTVARSLLNFLLILTSELLWPVKHV